MTQIFTGLTTQIFPDLSHEEKCTIDPAELAVPALINKVTQGVSFVDPTWLHRSQDILENGQLIGGYHFTTGDDPNAQVTLFLSNVESALGETSAPHLKLAVDWESWPQNQCSLAQCEQIVAAVRLATGKRPLLYMDYSRWRTARGSAILMACDLWLAEYGLVAKAPYKLWQFTDKHNFAGINISCDANLFAGSPSDLVAWWAT